MNINEYIDSKRKAALRIPSEIRERWNNRIVKNSWHLMGVAGAVEYLENYGRGIGVSKAVSLAICAESEGYPEIALGFWQKAFELETGEKTPTKPVKQSSAKSVTPKPAIAALTASATNLKAPTLVADLPPHLQPGRIVTMQPVDASMDRSYYIKSPDYWGQPKRDGSRRVIVATNEKIYYQSRSTKLKGQPTTEINQALLEAANQLGTFVLDGEVYYRSVTGSEHRTAPQAATTNAIAGAENAPVVTVYAIFKALYYSGRDLTTTTEAERIEAGEQIGQYLPHDLFEVLPTARTIEEKLALATKQQSEGREGEVWLLHNCTYIGGKDIRKQTIVRTKYALELELFIVGLSYTKAEGRPFGAIAVAQEIKGQLVTIGAVGTGFSQADMAEITRRHQMNPGGVKITVRCQGLTETGKLWHGRFVDLCDES